MQPGYDTTKALSFYPHLMHVVPVPSRPLSSSYNKQCFVSPSLCRALANKLEKRGKGMGQRRSERGKSSVMGIWSLSVFCPTGILGQWATASSPSRTRILTTSCRQNSAGSSVRAAESGSSSSLRPCPGGPSSCPISSITRSTAPRHATSRCHHFRPRPPPAPGLPALHPHQLPPLPSQPRTALAASQPQD